MVRAFTSGDVVQGKSGSATAVVDAGHSLDAATTAGHCGIIFEMAQTTLDTPAQWDLVIGAGSSDEFWQVGLCLRADLPAGESEWEIRSVGELATQWAWRAEEWSNVSNAPVLATARRNATTEGETNIPLGPTSPTLDTAELAALLVLIGIHSTGGAAFPATASYTNDFTETHVIQNGDGTGSAHVQLRIARKLLTSPETGPWSTTIDFGAQSMSGKNVYTCMAALRPQRHSGDT